MESCGVKRLYHELLGWRGVLCGSWCCEAYDEQGYDKQAYQNHLVDVYEDNFRGLDALFDTESDHVGEYYADDEADGLATNENAAGPAVIL